MVIGGKISFASLTLQVQKEDISKYEQMKVGIWLHMLNDGMNPTKWFKSNKSGTSINFESIKSQLEYDKAFAILKVHTSFINKEHGTEITFNENK
jgi:hypothetical protein